MASEVPKFGLREGDNARKKKINGEMMNLDDPQNNPDMFPQNGGPTAQLLRAADPKGQQSQAPQFAAWDNVGYTAYFGNKQKTKNGQPTVPTSEPKMNQDIHPPDQRTKLEPQLEAWQEVPVFEAQAQAQAQCVFDQHWGGNEWRKAPLNRARIPRLTGGARFPLLNQDRVDERAPSLVREDDEQVYGGGGSLTVQQTSGNSKDSQLLHLHIKLLSSRKPNVYRSAAMTLLHQITCQLISPTKREMYLLHTDVSQI